MICIKKHMALLGLMVEDRVTKFRGVVSSVCFDLYGCVQAVVNPGKGKDGKLGECIYFDVARLYVLSKKPVMPLPNYDYGEQAEGRQGASEKPLRGKA